MAPQPSAPGAQPPPDLPDVTDEGMANYLRNFALWCRNMFRGKLDAQTALPGILLQAYDVQQQSPPVYMLEVTAAGGLMLAPVTLGSGALGTPVAIAKKGVTDGSSAAAGEIGEVISAINIAPVTLTTGVVANVTSLSLTPGDWDVQGEVWWSIGAGGASLCQCSINNVSAALSGMSPNFARSILQVAMPAATTQGLPLRPARISLAATATYYLVAQAFFPSGATTATGNIWARRAR